MSWGTYNVPPSTVRKSFLRKGVRFGWGLYAIPNLPVVYNLIDFGEISHDAVRGLDVTAVKKKKRFRHLSTVEQTGPHTCASTGEGCTADRGSGMIWIRKPPSVLFFYSLDSV